MGSSKAFTELTWEDFQDCESTLTPLGWVTTLGTVGGF